MHRAELCCMHAGGHYIADMLTCKHVFVLSLFVLSQFRQISNSERPTRVQVTVGICQTKEW